ncbi:MAG TPA: TIGR03560 family F420-dependent LLM class oxidoreductase [Candidatus Limnocylindrales bacterium]|nr:TIGR03560 family F420-dependent LLM class oxidoreductase [Candidatus Limnocylindrales bacterium]
MKVGVIVPQGWTGEYAGVSSAEAWRRSVEIATRAEAAGADSLWLFDHMHTTPDPTDELTFESFTALTALATATTRAELGHIVSCAAYRNAGLQAKMLSTMDVISGGRMTAGVGAGWKREEWEAYGYPFPPTRVRLDRLEETLEIFTRMLAPGEGHATFEGEYAAVRDAINLPKPLRPMPIMVGGNGRERTWRLAARYADELNLDNMAIEDMPEALDVIRQRCEEIDRDPSTLRVSVHLWWEGMENAPSQADVLAAYAETGIARVMTLPRRAATDVSAVDELFDAARTAGCEIAAQPGPDTAAA